jgi:hypothetical protein
MAFQGALVKKSAAQTTANYSAGAVVAWDAETYDTDSAHDTVTNNSRITIPAAWDGKFGIITACISASLVTNPSLAQLIIRKNGSNAWVGTAPSMSEWTGNGQASTSGWLQISTGPVLLTSADFYEAFFVVEDSSITVATESSFGLFVIDPAVTLPSAAALTLAKPNADASANYSTPTAIAWNGTDVYDTHAVHDPSSNNTQLIIPASLNGKYVVVGAQVVATATGNVDGSVAIRYNGSLTYVGLGANSRNQFSNLNETRLQAFTQAIQIATGDTFDCLFYYNRASSTIIAAKSTLGLRMVG